MSDELRKKYIEKNGERPTEPYSTNENPEQWADIVEWEENLNKFLEQELKQYKSKVIECID